MAALTTAFGNLALYLITGDSGEGGGGFYNNTNSYIGAGDNNTAFSVSQTDLQATTNKFRKKVDTGYPTISGDTITFQATFADADAVFTWREIGVFNQASGGTMMARGLTSVGTKGSSSTWQVTVNVQVTAS